MVRIEQREVRINSRVVIVVDGVVAVNQLIAVAILTVRIQTSVRYKR